MEMARVILFTGQMDVMSRFYGEVLGLKQVGEGPHSSHDEGEQKLVNLAARVSSQ